MFQRADALKATLWLAMFLPAFVSRADDAAQVTVPMASVALYPRLGLAVKFPAGTEMAWYAATPRNYLWPWLRLPGEDFVLEVAMANDPSPHESLLPRTLAAIADRKNPIRLIGEPRLIRVNGIAVVEARFQSPQRVSACKSEWEAVRFYLVTDRDKLAFLQFSGLNLPEAEELAKSILPLKPFAKQSE